MRVMDRAGHFAIAVLVCAAMLGLCEVAGATHEQARLTASDRETNDYLGISVAVSGRWVIASAQRDDNQRGDDAGAAYVFRCDNGVWVEEDKLVPSDGLPSGEFGYCVAIDGPYAVVGTVRAGAGAVYVFAYNGSHWNQQAKLTASDPIVGSYFGSSVAIDGDRVVVGAIGDNISAGSIYVFKRSGSTWYQEAKCTAADAAIADSLGWSVSIDGSYIVAGAPCTDDNGEGTGSAYVFYYNGSSWVQQAKLLSTDGAPGDYLGMSVSIGGDQIVCGAKGDGDYGQCSGAAYVFSRTGSTWRQSAKLTASDAGPVASFGQAVAICGDMLLVTANGIGAAYVFQRDGSEWSELTKILSPREEGGDIFGYTAALGADYGVVGAVGADNKARAVDLLDKLSLCLAPVYRFWSPQLGRHFYTINAGEKNKLVRRFADVWMYEGISYYAFKDPVMAGLQPVYRFWSPVSGAHFYTMSQAERDKLIQKYPTQWTYEGPVFYAFAPDSGPAGTLPVYRFWQTNNYSHFFTINENEKNKLAECYSNVYVYEGIAWNAFP
jgi:hypothetical protein